MFPFFVMRAKKVNEALKDVLKPISKEKMKDLHGGLDLDAQAYLRIPYRDDELTSQFGANANVRKEHVYKKDTGSVWMLLSGTVKELYKVYRYYYGDYGKRIENFKKNLEINEAVEDIFKAQTSDEVNSKLDDARSKMTSLIRECFDYIRSKPEIDILFANEIQFQFELLPNVSYWVSLRGHNYITLRPTKTAGEGKIISSFNEFKEDVDKLLEWTSVFVK